MSAAWLETLDLKGRQGRKEECPEDRGLPRQGGWNPEYFAQEQIRGLVRQVFFSNGERPVRQVVLSAAEKETDVRSICRTVGEALAADTAASVAVVGQYPRVCHDLATYPEEIARRPARDGRLPLRQIGSRVRSNLWLVPPAGKNGAEIPTALVHSYLGEMRQEFEYSIVEGPAALDSHEATAMAQFSDGIILVLSAHRTRRITAHKIKEMLERAQVRVLGTVLCDRMFPIPERIYRHL